MDSGRPSEVIRFVADMCQFNERDLQKPISLLSAYDYCHRILRIYNMRLQYPANKC